jgi:hypothetical protein
MVKKKYISMFKGVMPGLALIIVFLGMFYLATDLGFSSDFFTDFIHLAPGLLCFGTGSLVVAKSKTGTMYVVAGFSFLALGLALLYGYAYDVGIINDVSLLGSEGLEQAQLGMVAFGFLIGCVVYAITSR